MKGIYLFISRNRKKWYVKFLHKVVSYLNNSLENKNNDHRTNGEFWLMDKLNKAGVNIIFDVGANVGKWSANAYEVFKSGTIYAFEPIPDIFNRLQNNVNGRERIHAFELALSREKGTLTFNYFPNGRLFSSIYDPYNVGDKRHIQVQVQCWDGDTFCNENGIDRIDFLKLDVEGSEHLVLTGFNNMLQGNKIKVIQFEYGTLSLESKFLLKDYYSLFSKYGYSVGKIYPRFIDFRPYEWSMENFICTNYVAIPTSETGLINSLR